jgi:hypothetical protein
MGYAVRGINGKNERLRKRTRDMQHSMLDNFELFQTPTQGTFGRYGGNAVETGGDWYRMSGAYRNPQDGMYTPAHGGGGMRGGGMSPYAHLSGGAFPALDPRLAQGLIQKRLRKIESDRAYYEQSGLAAEAAADKGPGAQMDPVDVAGIPGRTVASQGTYAAQAAVGSKRVYNEVLRFISGVYNKSPEALAEIERILESYVWALETDDSEKIQKALLSKMETLSDKDPYARRLDRLIVVLRVNKKLAQDGINANIRKQVVMAHMSDITPFMPEAAIQAIQQETKAEAAATMDDEDDAEAGHGEPPAGMLPAPSALPPSVRSEPPPEEEDTLFDHLEPEEQEAGRGYLQRFEEAKHDGDWKTARDFQERLGRLGIHVPLPLSAMEDEDEYGDGEEYGDGDEYGDGEETGAAGEDREGVTPWSGDSATEHASSSDGTVTAAAPSVPIAPEVRSPELKAHLRGDVFPGVRKYIRLNALGHWVVQSPVLLPQAPTPAEVVPAPLAPPERPAVYPPLTPPPASPAATAPEELTDEEALLNANRARRDEGLPAMDEDEAENYLRIRRIALRPPRPKTAAAAETAAAVAPTAAAVAPTAAAAAETPQIDADDAEHDVIHTVISPDLAAAAAAHADGSPDDGPDDVSVGDRSTQPLGSERTATTTPYGVPRPPDDATTAEYVSPNRTVTEAAAPAAAAAAEATTPDEGFVSDGSPADSVATDATRVGTAVPRALEPSLGAIDEDGEGEGEETEDDAPAEAPPPADNDEEGGEDDEESPPKPKPTEAEISGMTKAGLIAILKSAEVRGYSGKLKPALINMVRAHYGYKEAVFNTSPTRRPGKAAVPKQGKT